MFNVIFVVFVVSKMMGQYIIQSMLHMPRNIFHGQTHLILILLIWWNGVHVPPRR